MEKLSTELVNKIEKRPTNTILRSSDSKLSDMFDSIKTFSPDPSVIVPNLFDGRVVWRDYLTPALDQGSCGSCWAFASTSTLSDKFNIQSSGSVNLQLSPTKLILCDWQGKELVDADDSNRITSINTVQYRESACFGNTLYDAWRYLYIIGTPTLDCIPYELDTLIAKTNLDKITNLPLCTTVTGENGDMCSDHYHNTITGEAIGTPQRLYRCYEFYFVPGIPRDGGTEYNIRYDIYRWGPVSTAMKVYPDFYQFDPTKEIYEWNGIGPQVYGHAIELVGWGEEFGIGYWIVKNSWGKNWGNDGYFRMVRGINNCEIEENVVSGIPDFFYPDSHKPVKSSTVQNVFTNKQRNQITTQFNLLSGGIDSQTGYTRRSTVLYPWLDFSNPFPTNRNWDNFVAGRDVISTSKTNEHRTLLLILLIVLIVPSIILIVLVLVVMLKNKSRR